MFKNIVSIAIIFSVSYFGLLAQDAQDILKKMLENSHLNTFKSLYSESVMKLMGFEMLIKRWQKENNIRVETSFMGQNTIVVVTPKYGWIDNNGNVQDLLDSNLEKTIRSLKSQNFTSSMPFSIEEITKAEFIGEEKINGNPCFHLKLTIKDETEPVNIFIDKNNYEVKKTFQHQDFLGQSKQVEMLLSNYNTIDDFKFPKNIEILVDGESYGTIENTIVEINKEIEDKLFQK